MGSRRNSEQGFTEIYKGNKLIGLSFSVEDLWKRRVYIVYSGKENRIENKKRRRRVV